MGSAKDLIDPSHHLAGSVRLHPEGKVEEALRRIRYRELGDEIARPARLESLDERDRAVPYGGLSIGHLLWSEVTVDKPAKLSLQRRIGRDRHQLDAAVRLQRHR